LLIFIDFCNLVKNSPINRPYFSRNIEFYLNFVYDGADKKKGIHDIKLDNKGNTYLIPHYQFKK